MTLSLGLLLGLVSLAPPGDGTPVEVTTKAKSLKKWTLLTPVETWTPVGGAIKFAHAGGSGFPVVSHGPAGIEVDTDGDGKVDEKVKGAKGFLVLRSKDADGNKLEWALRFRGKKSAYEYSASGVKLAKFEGVTIQVLDLDNNGHFDDYGKDGLVVGKANGASYLSRVVCIKDALYSLEVDAAGNKLRLAPYEGETGQLELAKGFESKGKLRYVVVANEKGDVSFELSGFKAAVSLPVGEYKIVGGRAEKGSEHATIQAGRMRPLVLTKGKSVSVQWGMPIAVEYEFERNGEEVALDPNKLHYFGALGEEYTKWVPDGASPKIFVLDKETRKVLTTGRFGGC
jgi:hypothetical protein